LVLITIAFYLFAVANLKINTDLVNKISVIKSIGFFLSLVGVFGIFTWYFFIGNIIDLSKIFGIIAIPWLAIAQIFLKERANVS
jgi:hypothetical protein